MTSRFKKLGLGSVILGGAVAVSSFLFSGCKLDKNYWSSPRAVDDMAILSVVPAGLLPYAKTIPQAAALNMASQGLQTEAIRMSVDRMNNGQGDRGENQQNYQTNPRLEMFTGSEWVDNGDGLFDIDEELRGRGRVVFMVGEPYVYGVGQTGYKGRNLELVLHDPSLGLVVLSRQTLTKDSSHLQNSGVFDRPGNFHYHWEIDGVKIGDFLIRVNERPYASLR